MQEIPTVDGFHYVSLGQFVIAIVILVMLTIIIGYRNRATRPQYWILSAIEVVVFSYVWLFLTIMTELVVVTHILLPREVQLIIIDIIRVLLYLGFCVLLIIIEMHRRPSKTESEKPIETNE